MRKIVTTIGLAALGGMVVTVNAADEIMLKASVMTSAPVKVSKPLRELTKPLPVLSKERKFKMKSSGEDIPGYSKTKEVPNRFPLKDSGYELPKDFVDSNAQTSLNKNKNKAAAAQIGTSFDGINNVMGYSPPDTNGDVGPNHYVQTVNVAMAIWDKEGNQLMAPTAINGLWAGFGGLCEFTNNGDPIVLYDEAADRWLISQFAFDSSMTDNHECIAISTTSDPTGSYFLYDFAYGTLFNDYPHFGVWTDGYFMGVNQFGASFEGGGVVAYERDKMLVGAPAQQVKFDMSSMGSTVFTPMPLDMDGLNPPPAGANEYVVWADINSQDNLQVWEFDVDWVTPANSTFTPVASLPVTPYGYTGSLTQPNGQPLDALGVRSMFRAAYRNLDGQGKIVFNHTVTAPAGQGEVAMRWYELDVDQIAGTVSVAQEGTFAPDTHSRWMGSGAMDVNGNIGFGYSVASTTQTPTISGATRLATDPLNTLTDEFSLLTDSNGDPIATGSAAGASRWGDYSSMSVDPVDECTFWFSTEYLKADDDGSTAWSTRISSFKIPSCSAGPTGMISGTVTDSATNEVIPYASVTAGNSSTKADAEGNFTITLAVGDYEVSAYKYGWIASTAASVTVEEDETLDNDIVLAGATPVVVSGKVADVGAAGTALYAKVQVSVPGDTLTTYTNPETGVYSISLFEGTTVGFSASEIGAGGFLEESMSVLPTNATSKAMENVNFSLTPNSNCTAPGYEWVYPTFYEAFDVFPAEGWTVTDDADGVVWSAYSASGRSITGVDGEAAFADSDAAGPGLNADTSLVSPVINVADISTMVLEFDALMRTWSGADAVEVDVNVDGAGWVNVGALNETNSLDSYAIDLTAQLTGATSFQVRFHYFDANWEYYTLVDTVRFGDRSCTPVAGSLVTSYVTDANTGNAIVGASISLDGETQATSVATTDDDAVDDGMFQVFVADTVGEISISRDAYETATPATSDLTLATPVMLNAGQLEVDSESMVSVTEGREATAVVTVTNTGTAAAEVNAFFVKSNGVETKKSGPFHPSVRHFGPKNLSDLDTKKIRHFPEQHLKALETVEASDVIPTGITYGWGISRDKTNNKFYIGDLKVAGAPIDAIRIYEADGTLTTDSIELDFVGDGSFFADSAINQRTGMLWQINVSDNCIYEIDTTEMAVTGNTICPNFGTSQRGLAYDALSDTYYAGSWNDSIIHQFTTDGEILRSVNVGAAVAGLAFNLETGHLFASINNADDNFDVIVFDANTTEFDRVKGFDVMIDLDGNGYPSDEIASQAGLDMDCDGKLWIVDQTNQIFVGFDSGETGSCEWAPTWLSSDNTSHALAIDGSAAINLTVNGDMPAGDYYATMVVDNDTPYGTSNVPVSVTVTEPNHGTAQFVITQTEVNERDIVELLVERVDGADFAVSVDFASSDDTAIAGENYGAVSGTLTWADNDSSSKVITIGTKGVEDDMRFVVGLSNSQGGAALGAKVAMTVTIKDVPRSQGVGSFGPALMLLALAGLLRRRKAIVK